MLSLNCIWQKNYLLCIPSHVAFNYGTRKGVLDFTNWVAAKFNQESAQMVHSHWQPVGKMLTALSM
jgi:hypothetical protein